MSTHEGYRDEETPLLQAAVETLPPWSQISLAFLVMFAQTLATEYMFPFINQLIGEIGITGGDDRKIGYYAGLIESLVCAVRIFSTWQWCRMSDFIGRRPVILLSLLSLGLSRFAIGLSWSFSILVLSRCIPAILDGGTGVITSLIGDLTADTGTNMAQVFALLPATFCIGFSVASFYGGALVKPQERWPYIFQAEFWATYPYFLPSLVSGCFTLFAFAICAALLKESLPSKRDKRPQSENSTAESSRGNLLVDDVQPVSVSILLATPAVIIPIVNSGMLGLIDVGIVTLLPLFFSSPLGIGGLGFSPAMIGTVRAVFGIVDGCVQALFAPRLIKWVGAKRAFLLAVLAMYPLILFFPLMSATVKAQGKVGPMIWFLLVVQSVCFVFLDMATTVISIFLTRLAPNKQSLGSVNGLSQSLTSVARVIGPALIASSFAASKQYNILGGNFVYVVMIVLITILVVLSRCLPDLKDDENK